MINGVSSLNFGSNNIIQNDDKEKKSSPVLSGLVKPPEKQKPQPAPVLSGLVKPPSKKPDNLPQPTMGGLIKPPSKQPESGANDVEKLKELLDELNKELAKNKQSE